LLDWRSFVRTVYEQQHAQSSSKEFVVCTGSDQCVDGNRAVFNTVSGIVQLGRYLGQRGITCPLSLVPPTPSPPCRRERFFSAAFASSSKFTHVAGSTANVHIHFRFATFVIAFVVIHHHHRRRRITTVTTQRFIERSTSCSQFVSFTIGVVVFVAKQCRSRFDRNITSIGSRSGPTQFHELFRTGRRHWIFTFRSRFIHRIDQRTDYCGTGFTSIVGRS
jgi:hypothetical protein